MSDDKPQDPPEPKKPEPVLPGFEIIQVDNGSWTLHARGESPWYLTAFESPWDAQQWVLTYLTQNIKNSNNIHMKHMARREAHEAELKAELAKTMIAAEAATRAYEEAKPSKKPKKETVH